MKKVLRKTFLVGGFVGIVAFIAVIVLEVYAFIAYSDSFFTTSPNYEPLSNVAPVLWNLTTTLFIVTAICLILCVACVYIFSAIKGRR